MSAESPEDLALFFDPDEFGVEMLYSTPANALTHPANAVPVVVIFDREFIDFGEVEGFSPAATCPLAHVPGIEHGALLSEAGDLYSVVGIEPDGQGLVRLILEEL
ncbi:MAG: hypothetical protein COB61_004290 [Thiotrichales bacterium]|nr:hypothetical protein [Thiotrichales bacterium]